MAENEQYHLFLRGEDYYFPKEDDKEKYIVCACAKNEDEYIVEWVEHYLNYGFDKVLIADNNGDNTVLPQILKEYINKGQVQIFDVHGLKQFQVEFYEMILLARNFKWCAFFDCDEFVELNTHAKIGDFLKDIKEDTVLVNWLMYGSNGQIYKKKGSVQERFKTPVCPILYMKENMYVKTIIRQDHRFTRFWSVHAPMGEGTARYNLGGDCAVNYGANTYGVPKYKYIYLKHYYTKSYEEWVKNKTQRGWADCMGEAVIQYDKYFILEDSPSMPIDKMCMSIFDDNTYKQTLYKDNKEHFDFYKAIEIRSTTQNFYAITTYVMSLMRQMTDHVIILSNENINDTQFAIFLEYAIKTGNRVCWCKNQDEIEQALRKYDCQYYFIKDCQ